MDLRTSCYWRDAALAGLQFTTNQFLQCDIRAHRHGGFTLAVADTALRIRTASGVVTVPPDTLVRIAPLVWHAVQAHATPWREEALYCSLPVARSVWAPGPSVASAETSDHAPVTVFQQFNAARDFRECHRLLREAQGGGRGIAAEAGRALLRERLARWLPADDSTAGPPATAALEAADADERLLKTYELIATGFHQRLTLEALAESVGWHPVHLQRRFKNAWGFSPHDLLVGHRIEYARDLIAGGALITHAAHAAGFSDQSHLHKTFLSTYAVLPGEYRRLSALDALQPPSARNGIVD